MAYAEKEEGKEAEEQKVLFYFRTSLVKSF